MHLQSAKAFLDKEDGGEDEESKEEDCGGCL
jgi:hypothetical protein